MGSFDEAHAALRQRMASGAARSKAAPADPRRKAAVMQARAAPLREKFAANRDRVGFPDPALVAAASLAEQTLSRLEELKALKSQYRDLQSQLHQALSLKSHKESEYKRIAESIVNATSTIGELKVLLMELRQRKDTWGAIILDQLQDIETHEAALSEDIEAAVSWFEKFLGWQITVGEEGVKFVFDKIDPQCPDKEYSLCIRIDNGTYNLLQCDPAIKDFEEPVKDLNLTGDLCKFLKVARERFLAASVNGNLPLSSVACTDVLSVPFSPPVNRTSEDVPSQSNSRSKNKSLPAKRRGTAPSPGNVRRSPRLLEGSISRKN